jgi:uncharacterized protein (DUF2252 family)
MSLDQALDALAAAELAAEAARLRVWAAIQAEHPDVADAVASIGFSGDALLKWLCQTEQGHEQSPAQLIASGHGDRVASLARRAQHGFF